MNNDDFYYHGSSEGERTATDISVANDHNDLTNNPPHVHYQSMDTIQKDKPPAAVIVGRIIKNSMTALMCILVILAILALATHGSVFFYDRVEGVVTEKETISHAYSRSYTIRYKINVEYTYNGKEYNMVGRSASAKMVGQKVYVYINRLDPTAIRYLDNSLSVTWYLLPAILFLFALRAFGAELANEKKRSSKRVRDII